MLEKKEINILIVEDDKDFGQVLLSSLNEAGYSAQLVHDPKTALSFTQSKTFEAAVVDCLLPKISGLDLVKKLKEVNKNLKTVLITGVYKNESFFHEALAETKAYDLLFKPFEPQTLLLTLENLLSDLIKEKRRLSLKLLTRESFETEDIRNILNYEKTFSGLELPYLYSLIFNSSLSGRLSLISKGKKPSNIDFINGEVVNIQLDDKESYFGALLVEKGFTTQNDLESGLKTKKKKPIGEELVELNALSPHAIKIIQKEQVKIRLSKTINSENLKIEFNEKENKKTPKKEQNQDKEENTKKAPQKNDKEAPETNLSLLVYGIKNEIETLLSEWILSRVSSDWLKSFYIPWYGSVLNKTKSFSKIQAMKDLCVLNLEGNELDSLISQIESKTDLSQIIEKHKKNESSTLKAIYFLLINKMIYFVEGKIEFNEEKIIKQLDKISKDIQGKNHFELLGLSRTATEKDILDAYHHFTHFLHPDRLNKGLTKKTQILSKKVFSKIVVAYNVLRDKKSREKYIQEIDKTELQMKSVINKALNKILDFLLNAQYDQAFKDLEKIKENKMKGKFFMIYYLWAFIKSKNYQFMISKKNLNSYLKSLLNKIPLEDRHNHYYFYIRGLVHTFEKNEKEAKKCFLQTLALAPKFKMDPNEIDICKKAS